jgi:FkbM family methyltransferase
MNIICTLPISNLNSYLFQRAKLNLSVSVDRKIGKRTIVHKDILGHQIQLDFTDLDQRYLYEEHIREPENIFTYIALTKAGICHSFIDIGANYGHEALILLHQYKNLILIEPNPKICPTLGLMFKNEKSVEIINAAVVGEGSPNEIMLKVPIDSSALASIVESPLMREEVETFRCKAVTLKDIVKNITLDESYIKIDVEGAEYLILESSKDIVMQSRAIVGFEALSREMAQKCANLFENYAFYYARFDFIDDNGSLKNPLKLLKSILGWKNSISVYKIDGSDFSKAPNNFSQVYCVPNEKQRIFEDAVKAEKVRIKVLDMRHIANYK